MDNKNRIITFNVILLLVLLCQVIYGGHELLELPKPTHTEQGVPCATLKVIKEIESDFDEDLFFAFPLWITVGKQYEQGRFYFYIYDFKLVKVFVFNEKFKCVGQFLDHGQGPGEVNPGRPGNLNFFAAPDGTLYVSRYGKIMQFSAEGKHIKDFKIPWDMRSTRQFFPVVDEKGNFYLHSTNNGIVDKFDREMNRVHTFLDIKLNYRFVGYKPDYEKYLKGKGKDYYHLSSFSNAIFDITSDGHLLVYLYRSSTVFLFKDDRLARTFNVYIDRLLPIFEKRAKAAYEFQNSRKRPGIRSTQMFGYCFADRDEPYFYLSCNDENKTATLYQFDLKGKLVQVFKNINAAIKAKRHGLYFGLAAGDKHPVIFKKEDSR